MHFSGALLTLYVSFLAHSTTATSLDTTLLARDTQQFPLEPRGNAISAAKEKLKASPADGNQSSSGSAKKPLGPKIQCSGNDRVHCVRRCSCTIDGTVQCNDGNTREFGFFVPYSKAFMEENAEKQMGSVTEICSKICGCEVDGIFKLGGRTGVKVNISKEQKSKAESLDKVVREGRGTVLDSIPEVNLQVLPDRPSPHTAEISSASLTTDIAPANHTIDVVHAPANEKSSARKKAGLLQKFRRRPKASRTIPTLPFVSSSVPQIYWDMFELFPGSQPMRPLDPHPDPGHLLPSPPIAPATKEFRFPGRTRSAAPALQATRTRRTGSSRQVPVLPFPTSHIPEWVWDVPLKDVDARLHLSSGEMSPPVDRLRTGSTPSINSPPNKHDIEMVETRPSPSRHPFADEASSSTDAPRIYRRGNSHSAKVKSDGYEIIPESPSEAFDQSLRHLPHITSRVSPIVCATAARAKCESGCHCADDGNVACNRRTDAEWKEISLTSRLRGQDPNRLLEATKIYLMKMCVPICGCEKDGVTRVNGRTKEEWLELRKQAARGKKKSGNENNRSDTSGSLEKQVKPESTPASVSATGADENTPPAPLTAIVQPPSLIRRDQALIAKPLHNPPPSSSAKTISAPVAHTDSMRKRDGKGRTAETTQIVCNDYMKQACEQNCRCNTVGQLICDKMQGLGGSGAPENWLRAQTKVMEEYKEDCTLFCSCEQIHSAHKSSNKASSSPRKVPAVRGPRVVRRGDMENAAETTATVQPVCQRSSKTICEKNCYCTDGGKFRCDTIIPRSFAEYESLEMSLMTTVKLRQDYIKRCAPHCKCENVSDVQPAHEATYSSTKGSTIFETHPDKVSKTPSTKALIRPTASIGRDLTHSFVKRTQTPSEPEGSSDMSRRPICSRWDLERKRQCEARCYCNIAGEVKCDTQYPEHFHHLVLFAHFRSLSKEAAEQMRADQIRTVTNFCIPVCRCPRVPFRSTSAPTLSSQESHAAQLPPPSHTPSGVSSSSTLASSLHHRRGESRFSIEARLSKPICENLISESCFEMCRCVEDTKDGPLKVKCDVRYLLKDLNVIPDARHKVRDYNSDLTRQCSRFCKCDKNSPATTSLVEHSKGSSVKGLSAASDTNYLHVPRSPSKVSSFGSLYSLHRRGRPFLKHDPFKPTCQGHGNDYCQQVCNCMPDGSIQ